MPYKITTAKEGQREVELIKPINLYVSVEHGSYLRPEAWRLTPDAWAVLTSMGVHGKQLFISAELQVFLRLSKREPPPPPFSLILIWNMKYTYGKILF